MKNFYTLEEVLSASDEPLSLLDIIDYCRRSMLHPCVYLDGNLVCIEETREHHSEDKRDYPEHVVEAKWHVPFQGYVFSQDLIEQLRSKNQTFNLLKIDQIISQYSEIPLNEPELNQSLHIYERRYDDDVKDFFWIRDMKDEEYKGIEYSKKEIVFHIEELKRINFNDPDKRKFDALRREYNHEEYKHLLFSKPSFSIHEAASIVSMNNPLFVEVYRDQPNFVKYFQHYLHSYNLISSWSEDGILGESEMIPAELLKETLKKNKILIQSFNAHLIIMEEGNLTVEHKRINEQNEEIERLRETIKNLNTQIEQLQSEQSLEPVKSYNLLDLILDSTDNERYAPDLAYAIQLWESVYVTNPKSGKHSNKANIWIKNNTPYSGDRDDTYTRRLRDITSPLIGWHDDRKKLLINN